MLTGDHVCVESLLSIFEVHEPTQSLLSMYLAAEIIGLCFFLVWREQISGSRIYLSIITSRFKARLVHLGWEELSVDRRDGTGIWTVVSIKLPFLA